MRSRSVFSPGVNGGGERWRIGEQHISSFPPSKNVGLIFTREEIGLRILPLSSIFTPIFKHLPIFFFFWARGKRGQGRIFSTLFFLLDLSRKMGRIFGQANFSLPFSLFFCPDVLLNAPPLPKLGKKAWRSIKWKGEIRSFYCLFLGICGKLGDEIEVEVRVGRVM